MDGPPSPSSPKPIQQRRELWVFVFLLVGLPALFSAMILPFSPAAALPWVVVLWSIAGAAGYRIWRIDHPNESARSAVGLRLAVLIPTAAFGIAVLIFREYPVLLVLIVVVWLLLLLLLGLGMWYAERSMRR
jgi:hypothetical protein